MCQYCLCCQQMQPGLAGAIISSAGLAVGLIMNAVFNLVTVYVLGYRKRQQEEEEKDRKGREELMSDYETRYVRARGPSLLLSTGFAYVIGSLHNFGITCRLRPPVSFLS